MKTLLVKIQCIDECFFFYCKAKAIVKFKAEIEMGCDTKEQ